MLNQEVIFALGGQKFFYDAEARPSAPSCTVYLSTSDDDSAAETATSGGASVESVDTTSDGAVSAGAQTIVLDDVANIARGRRYLFTDATTGIKEWLDVITLVTATKTIGLRQPLRNSFADASTLQSTRITINVLDSWAATKAKLTDVLSTSWRTDREVQPWIAGAAGYRLRWSYTANGAVTLGVSFADLVRYQAKNLVTPLDVDRRFPGWIDRLPTDYLQDQGQALIDEAYQAMRMDCLGDEQLVRRIRNTEVLRELVVYRANLVAQEAALFAGGASKELVASALEIYGRRYKQLIREPKVPVDSTGGGSSSQARRLPATRR